jgi:hypothetical protein
LPITPEEFAQFYPRLYHMAEADSWPSIQRHGLLSTTALLDLFEISGDERTTIESVHRPNSVPIRHPTHGTAIIRDQKPMSDKALLKCLEKDTSPRQWYEILNRQVFFWVISERVESLLHARAYREIKQTVITLDTDRLLERYAPLVRLSPINSGSTIYRPQPRGAKTFQLLRDYPFAARKRIRGLAHAVAELTLDYSVPDISNFVISVEHRLGDRVEPLYPRPEDR